MPPSAARSRPAWSSPRRAKRPGPRTPPPERPGGGRRRRRASALARLLEDSSTERPHTGRRCSSPSRCRPCRSWCSGSPSAPRSPPSSRRPLPGILPRTDRRWPCRSRQRPAWPAGLRVRLGADRRAAGRSAARPGAALAFLLSAPAINPVVMVATAVAFPGRPEVVLARFLASLAATRRRAGVGAHRPGRACSTGSPRRHDHGPRRWPCWWRPRSTTCSTPAGSSSSARRPPRRCRRSCPASSSTRSPTPGPGGSWRWRLAVVMAICSEADAFVAASLTQFSLTARLAFMVVGPMVDVKLVALQAGTFGPRFAALRPADPGGGGGVQRGRRMVAPVSGRPAGRSACCSVRPAAPGGTLSAYGRYVRLDGPVAGARRRRGDRPRLGTHWCARSATARSSPRPSRSRRTPARGWGWLLLAPIAALLLVAPPTLGSYGVDRGAQGGHPRRRRRPDPLRRRRPGRHDAAGVRPARFDQDGASFRRRRPAHRVRGGPADGGFRLARYQIACCAADAAPVVVREIGGLEPRPHRRGRSRAHQPGGGELAALAATNVVELPATNDPRYASGQTPLGAAQAHGPGGASAASSCASWPVVTIWNPQARRPSAGPRRDGGAAPELIVPEAS